MNRTTCAEQLLIIDPCLETQSRIARCAEERKFSVTAVADPAAAILTQGTAA